MNDHSRRLIYHDQVGILVHYIDGNVLGSESVGRPWGQLNIYLVICPNLVRRLGGIAVNHNVRVFDQTLQPRAAPTFNPGGEETIKPLACFFS
jgi:hypothetical protein